ncbi:Proline dehydrogenase / Delta-1-pyrroline-5-carboxylate dehydrogenase [hydrothermal vent metagenome]|uniref:Proline dehydrogenase / Delta-1-pyrroline-5-carboxylate dehydrogenase n=1 Tax=hydrothermal vent metagenome TaxID=652676 RepID=A0A3B1AJ33_9ZZZZ
MFNIHNDYSEKRQAIVKNYVLEENAYVDYLLTIIGNTESSLQSIQKLATSLVLEVRTRHTEQQGMLAFIRQYNLSTEEGMVLMCLAEALLRIPDAASANKLIRDKLSQTNWQDYLGESDSAFVNAATWGLLLSGKLVQLKPDVSNNISHYINTLINKSSETIIRAALKEAMRFMGTQFVLAETIEDAIKHNGLFSFDMLGEAAISADTAERYFNDYLTTIKTIAQHQDSTNSISIKLSALHCRYEFSQQSILQLELYPKLKDLIETAIKLNVAITLDAEESNRLDIMLDAFQYMYDIALEHNWSHLGIAVQAYQFRALPVLKWLNDVSTKNACNINVRLVKGAYWDSEIKLAQQQGLEYYPVYTRKENTDLAYLCCAQYLFSCKAITPQFATHNAHTISSIIEYSKSFKTKKFEFQRLFGMGELLYDCLFKKHNITCRVYAPVGDYKSLLSYLVRRLLENGANSSFVQRIENIKIDVASITRDPLITVKNHNSHCNPNITLPSDIFKPSRKNAAGINLSNIHSLKKLDLILSEVYHKQYHVTPIINGISSSESSHYRTTRQIINPANSADVIAQLELATQDDINNAMTQAKTAFKKWSSSNITVRSDCLVKLSNLIEENTELLIALCIREAGRCIHDALAEIREAIDFCRYYATKATELFEPQELAGPTGETNILKIQARGIFVCISPWNFPIAIFTGQIVAALVSGNCVLAKPAQQSSLCASKIIELCYLAGIPKSVLYFLPAASADSSDCLLQHSNLAGVVFTGSLTSANKIKHALVSRAGAIVPLIAETGGMNAMIVDSSALAEQVVVDIVNSAFNSAGQRCSSLRFLYLQNDIADNIIDLLIGAVVELSIADPRSLATDIGPLIDQKSKAKIIQHLHFLNDSVFANSLYDVNLTQQQDTKDDLFIHPAIYEIKKLCNIPEEVFGPVLHIIRYPQADLRHVVDEINDSGFGLTLGIHSRISSNIELVCQHAKVGNIYVNRNIIGAVVGVQPFGGQGCSGTGPKAGGPHYLKSFCTEQVISTNITAIGGNSALLNTESD